MGTVKDVTVLGEDVPCGSYLLRIAVAGDLIVRFGRFRQGSPVAIARGDVVYIGSAMARSGSMTLARRLLRHATRSTARPPHHLRRTLIGALHASGLAWIDMPPPADKKLFWNIDYLLDEEDVELRQVIVLRSSAYLEDAVANLLLADPNCRPVAPGLGAHDRPGSTHLLQVRANEAWWHELPSRLGDLL